MLVIRDAQVDALQQAMDAAFLHRLAKLIRQRHPLHPSAQSDAVLLPVVMSQVGEARAYGITSGQAIADYVGLKFDVGFSFNSHPLLRAHLERPAMEPDEKIRNLMRSLTDDDWRTIRMFCSEGQGVSPVPE